MIKNYVLDTNVLIHDPNAIHSFEDNNLIIPLPVIEEIDKLKGRPGEIGMSARHVARELDDLRKNGKLFKGIRINGGGTLRVEVIEDFKEMPRFLSDKVMDDWILFYTMEIIRKSPDIKTILVSKDINMRIKADALGIEAQDYLKDKTDEMALFKGYIEINGDPQNFDPVKNKVMENEFVKFDSKIFKFKNGKLIPISVDQNTNVWGIHPLNFEQSMALDLLLDPDLDLVTLMGIAGTGKTLLSIAAALEMVTNAKIYKKITVTRPVIPMGKDIGFLPGSAEEKMKPWLEPIRDNLEFLFDNAGKSISKIDSLNFLQVEALSYTRGRTIPHQFIIVDESQNLTPHEVKTIITRAGVGTKIVLTGDISQIDSPYLDAFSNGLSYVTAKFANQKIAGHLTLSIGVRSDLSTLASEIL
ncbi:MAG: phosphate starvation-inducible protein PhoH [Mesoaciditoga sp.]|uniref:PhoH family protein n=1 Tax=Athalassotoga sp. TaxID=2022597 RepID=UPI000CC26696|nr:MAG: phosphate starvation-inducible protein PhoH [Mesoaciditoga sp.]PMP79118.1 MAG: phosphate starvation-inducible protein PhoH [Mesoaciditoga sp.]HEU24948.1 PhoH family protein [Mesoaciditoga lauensis]